MNTDMPQVDVEVQMPEDQAALDEKRLTKLEAFGANLGKTRDEWIRARAASGVDKRWTEDTDQYEGRDNVNRQAALMMASVEQGYPVTTNHAKPVRSTVFIGMTRAKTNSAEARIADILLPTDDRNWGIKPTPQPRLAGLAANPSAAMDPTTGAPIVGEDGQPLRVKAVARAVIEIANKKAEAMQNEIADQLNEASYNGEVHKVIHNAAVLGTGVLKGPIVTNRTRKAWAKRVDARGEVYYELEIQEERSPASFSANPRYCWPDPSCGDNIHNGKGHFELEKLTAKQVRDLAKQPGFMREQLRKVLEEGPKPSNALIELAAEENRDHELKTYEMWTYWGEVEHDEMEAAGVETGEKDILRTISACVVMINSTVVKAYLNPLDGGDIPYDYYVWEKVYNSPHGYGVPRLMNSQQRVLNSAWRMMMDNAGITARGQVVLKYGAIKPADKQWQVTAGKLWYATDEVDDVSKAFNVFEFQSHQTELENIIKMATELADAETGHPQLMQGEKGAAPDTVGGMQMLMNSASVVLRRLVKQFDDMVTRPHITRYYDYNMLYNEDDEIKGDFSVDARGSSVLLVRDIQNQAFLNLLAAGANPIYGKYLDTKKLFEKALQAQHIDPAEVFKTDEEIDKIDEIEKQRAEQGPAPDPRIQAAQLRAQADGQKVQAQVQGDLQELQLRQQIAQQDHEFRLAELEHMERIEMLKMSNQQNISLDKIKAQLADVAIRERTKKDLFQQEADLKMRMGTGI